MGIAVADQALVKLERELGASWAHLSRAREAARDQRQRLESAVAALVPEDTSIVVFGSLARDEFTSGSDVDWTLLVDGLANPQHLDVVFEIEDRIEGVGGKHPGREGTFGGLAFSHEILHNIGGSDDSNRNTTQRICCSSNPFPSGEAKPMRG